MSVEGFATDVCLDADITKAPHCPHGPTLVFERCAIGAAASRRFYACSACRDRKDCQFFQWEDAEISESTKAEREKYLKSHGLPYTQEEYYERFQTVKSLDPSERKLCKDCGLLLLPDEWPKHKKHDLLSPLSNDQLHSPTQILPKIENKKTNAQYLFSEVSTQFTLSTIKELGYSKVLCVGAPRIHEAISEARRKDEDHSLESLLLDIDHRHMQFYDPAVFCRYNMFNNYFMDGESCRKKAEEFIESEREEVVVVIDPPFGGLVEVLAHNLKKLMFLSNSDDAEESDLEELPVLWYFPYYLEPRVVGELPQFRMLDYKVDYDNHPLMRAKSKKGSPVRIFTNIDAAKIKLPASEGYRLCSPCKRYVSKENIHCEDCNACNSKDGSTYKHCDKCARCVKPSREHCNSCNQCDLPGHKCGKVKPKGCFVCGDLTHKRRDCPEKNAPPKGGQEAVKIPGDIGKKKATKRPWENRKHNQRMHANKKRKKGK